MVYNCGFYFGEWVSKHHADLPRFPSSKTISYMISARSELHY